MSSYKKNSITLIGSVALGTGVMIGAGIFALIGQVAQLSGQYVIIAFILGATVAGFSAYSYICLSNAFPSAGGIAMYLKKAYGKSTITASAALLMVLSMVINESLVARTFGSYIHRLFDNFLPQESIIILGVILVVFAFIINNVSNKSIQNVASLTSAIKIIGITIFSIVALMASSFEFDKLLPQASNANPASPLGFIASISLCILAYKGFTTITNSGSEIKNPHKNVGRSIMISIVICTLLYALVILAVTNSLTIDQLIEAKDYALAEAAEPALGQLGVIFTVIIAIVATVSGIIGSVFAVSRMSAMLVDMDMIPFYSFRKNQRTQKNTLIYISGISLFLTLFFDLSRIASLGAIVYILMDIIIHVGLIQKLKDQVSFKPLIVYSAIVLDVIVLIAFVVYKLMYDPFIVIVSLVSILVIFAMEKLYLRNKNSDTSDTD